MSIFGKASLHCVGLWIVSTPTSAVTVFATSVNWWTFRELSVQGERDGGINTQNMVWSVELQNLRAGACPVAKEGGGGKRSRHYHAGWAGTGETSPQVEEKAADRTEQRPGGRQAWRLEEQWGLRCGRGTGTGFKTVFAKYGKVPLSLVLGLLAQCRLRPFL